MIRVCLDRSGNQKVIKIETETRGHIKPSTSWNTKKKNSLIKQKQQKPKGNNKNVKGTYASTDFPVSSGLRTVKGLGSTPTVLGINSLH